jgi:hypothetical protein
MWKLYVDDNDRPLASQLIQQLNLLEVFGESPEICNELLELDIAWYIIDRNKNLKFGFVYYRLIPIIAERLLNHPVFQNLN